ncbi:SagB family peptide dehydrogenase [Nonomuraea fastidiosa]|uniref:SagB family peptide dehydrogenase n=1 Tax=Nonomuraea TaxID=83681 RepID=UPI0034233D46
MHTTTAAGAATSRYLDAMRNRGPLSIDWASAPTRHKRYPGAERVRLPWTAAPSPSGLGMLGELLRNLLGVTRIVWSHYLGDGGELLGRPPMLLTGRPAPSGGGLYPIEAYVAARQPHLPAALYHYDPVHHVLERVRGGDHVPALTGLLGGTPSDVVIVLSAVFWRSMFKYGDFAYRLICQETGVLIAQALAVGERLGVTGGAHLRFPDDEVNRLLGLDDTREATMAALTLSLPEASLSEASLPDPEPPTPEQLIAQPAASENRPLPRAMPSGCLAATLHRACTLVPQRAASPDRPQPPTRTTRTLPAPEPAPLPHLTAGIARRASPIAGYRPVPIPGGALGAVLAAAGAGYPSDLPGTDEGPAATALYVLSLRVDGLPRAAYWYDPANHTLHVPTAEAPIDAVTTGRLLPNTRVALRGAAAVLIPAGDPLAGAPPFGDRWYRMQQMEAGLIAQRAALAATALGLAARIHSDGANETTDAVLGLAGSPLRSLSFLVMGTPPTGGPLVTRPIPGPVDEEVMPAPTTA